MSALFLVLSSRASNFWAGIVVRECVAVSGPVVQAQGQHRIVSVPLPVLTSSRTPDFGSRTPDFGSRTTDFDGASDSLPIHLAAGKSNVFRF